MKLRNKKTGEIRNCQILADGLFVIDSISKLNEEWEDYEEPKGYWYYDTTCGRVEKLNHDEDKEIDDSIGNCFATKEEAEKAVEKLKAWKRMKDKGFRFQEWYKPDGCSPFIVIETNIVYDVYNKELQADLDLLFGGEYGRN